MYDTLVDIRSHWAKAFTAPEGERDQAISKFMADQLPPWSGFFEKALHAKGPYSFGSDLTYVDLFLFLMMEAWFGANPTVLADKPKMKRVYDAVKAQPKVAAYLESGRRHKAVRVTKN